MLNKNGNFVRSEIKIGSWNINGIWQRINSVRYNKLSNPDVTNLISSKLICGLIETHHTANEVGNLHAAEYKCFSFCRPTDKNVKR